MEINGDIDVFRKLKEFYNLCDRQKPFVYISLPTEDLKELLLQVDDFRSEIRGLRLQMGGHRGLAAKYLSELESAGIRPRSGSLDV